MSEPLPDPTSPLALLRGAPPPLRESPNAIWHRVTQSASQRSRPRLVLTFSAALAVGCLAVVSLQPVLRPTHIEASNEAVWHRDADQQITLERGQLHVRTTSSVAVRTQFGSATVTDGQLSLDVDQQRLLVSGAQGLVEVHSSLGDRILRPGESLQLVRQVALSAQKTPEALLQTDSVEPRSACGEAVDCLTETAKGSSLAAQLALFDLGVAANRRGQRAQAIAAWREYLERFPDGVLAPEASGALVRALVAQAPRDALAQAEQYHQQFGAEPSAGGIELLRAHLLRDVGGQFDSGCALYDSLRASASTAVHLEAVYQSAMCARARGDAVAVQRLGNELLQLAPQSARAAQWLEEK